MSQIAIVTAIRASCSAGFLCLVVLLAGDSWGAEPAPPAEAVCPNYTFPDETYFGVSAESAKTLFSSCKWETEYSPDSQVLLHFTAPARWYSSDLVSWLGNPRFQDEMIEVDTVQCSCWSAVLRTRLIFFRIDGSTRLVAVEKDFRVNGGIVTAYGEMKASISSRTPVTPIEVEDGYRIGYPSTTVGAGKLARWDAPSFDLILAANNMPPFAGDLRTLLVNKVEWARYSGALAAKRRAREEEDARARAKAAGEL